MRRLNLQPSYLWSLFTTNNHQVWDTAAGVRCIQRKQWGGRRASELSTARSVMDVLFICCAVEVRHHWRLATSLVTLQRYGTAPVVPDVAYSCLYEDCIPRFLVVNSGPGCANIILRWYFVCAILYSSDDTMSRYFRLYMLIVVACIRFFDLGGPSMGALLFFLSQRRFPFCRTSNCSAASFEDTR